MKRITRILQKHALLCMAMFVCSFALEAPYLISVVAKDDRTIEISWRNNDVTSEGYFIERLNSGNKVYQVIDTIIHSSIASYIDTEDLKSSTEYSYQIRAYNQSATSETSNYQKITTLAAFLKKPGVQIYWNSDTSKSVRITINDSSSNETGYRIYRSDGCDNTSGVLLKEILSKNTVLFDSIDFMDSAVSINKWYNYQITVFNGNETSISNSGCTFTFRDKEEKNIYNLTKVGEIPITLGGWSAKSGDSIILKESNAPAGNYTAINIKDPSNPKFVGYIDSATLVASNLNNSEVSICLQSGVSGKNTTSRILKTKDKVIVLSKDKLIMYKNVNPMIEIKSTNFVSSRIFLVNDSILCSNSGGYSFIKMQSSGFAVLKNSFSDMDVYVDHNQYLTKNSVNGVIEDSTIIISTYNSRIGTNDPTRINRFVNAYNVNTDSVVTVESMPTNTEFYNLGVSVSKRESLCLHKGDKTELFIADKNNSRCYKTALENDALYSEFSNMLDSIQNIMVDTNAKEIIIATDKKLVILKYEFVKVGAIRKINMVNKERSLKIVMISKSNLKIAVPNQGTGTMDISIIDMNGKLVGRLISGSNEVNWNTKNYSKKCYIINVVAGQNRYISKYTLN